MAITNAFRDAVENGNVIGIRIMLKDSLLVDLSFNEFEEMERIALSDVCNLYDKHDGCDLLLNETMWDDNYMNGLMVDVVDNFSRERVEHLKKVVRKLRPVSATLPSTVSSEHQHRGLRSLTRNECQLVYPEFQKIHRFHTNAIHRRNPDQQCSDAT